ncbi:MAG: invasion associated locus B family protein [Rhodobacteraceae bacterium]|nr:invasion associated locus B family protein [Paracoccaceae bacterium]
MTGSRRAMAAAVLAGLVATPVSAERLQNGARFGDWTVACEAVAVNETICVLSQRLVAREGERFLTELLAFNDTEEPVAYLAARVPLGVYFPAGFSMRPEGGDTALDFEWQSCGEDLCEALLVLDADALAALEQGPAAIAGYVPRTGAEALVFRIGTEGLSGGLVALARALGVPGPGREAEE